MTGPWRNHEYPHTEGLKGIKHFGHLAKQLKHALKGNGGPRTSHDALRALRACPATSSTFSHPTSLRLLDGERFLNEIEGWQNRLRTDHGFQTVT
jgi:hypothetical protein